MRLSEECTITVASRCNPSATKSATSEAVVLAGLIRISAGLATCAALAGTLAERSDLDAVLARQRAESAARVLRDVDVDAVAIGALAGAETLGFTGAD